MTLRELLERIRLLNPKPHGLELAAHLSASRRGHVSRRAFLGIVGTALVAANIDPEALAWSPGERTIILPPERIFAPEPSLERFLRKNGTKLDWVVHYAARALEREIGDQLDPVYQSQMPPEPVRIGETLMFRKPRVFDLKTPPFQICDDVRPVMLSRQYSLCLDGQRRAMLAAEPAGSPLACAMIESYVKDIARMMKRDGVNVVGRLPLPMGVHATARVDSSRGVSVRGIEQYDIQFDQTMLRFDVIGAKV